MSDKGEELIARIVDMDTPGAVDLAAKMLDEGTDPFRILALCRSAMDIVGRKFEEGEFFVPELILSGDTLERISALVKPRLADTGDGPAKKHGRVLIGTVAGDLHDIGKNIVTFMLDVNNFEVMDIGIDVPVSKFVETIREFKPDVVGLSGFLTLAYDSMKTTIDAIKEAGLRDRIKVMIGGGQVDEVVLKYTRADAFGLNAMDAVRLCREWMGVTAE